MRDAIKKKAESVSDVINKLSSAKHVGIVNLEGLPNQELKNVRHSINNLKLIIKPRNVLKRALEQIPQLKELINYLKGNRALFIYDDSVFKLSIKLDKLRVPAFAKEGQIIDRDVIVEAGPTAFMPGPMMTEMAEVGIKASAKGGKLNISEPAKIVKTGDKLKKSVSDMLFKLGIKPVTLGMEIIAGIDDGKLFIGTELRFDAKKIMTELLSAYGDAQALALNANIINEATIESIIARAHSQAINLSCETEITTKETIENILLIAKFKAEALASAIKWEVKA